MELLKKNKEYSVKDCADFLKQKEHTVRRHIDDFELGTKTMGKNNVEKRVLNDEEFKTLQRIFLMKKEGLSPSNIKTILNKNLILVNKDEYQVFQERFEKGFESFGQRYLEMQEVEEERKKETSELKNEFVELKKLIKEQNDRIEELEKNPKKPFWKFWK